MEDKEFPRWMSGLEIGGEEALLHGLEFDLATVLSQDGADWSKMVFALSDFVGLSWDAIVALSDAEMGEAAESFSQEDSEKLSAVYHLILALSYLYRLKASGHLAGDVDRLKEAILTGLAQE